MRWEGGVSADDSVPPRVPRCHRCCDWQPIQRMAAERLRRSAPLPRCLPLSFRRRASLRRPCFTEPIGSRLATRRSCFPACPALLPALLCSSEEPTLLPSKATGLLGSQMSSFGTSIRIFNLFPFPYLCSSCQEALSLPCSPCWPVERASSSSLSCKTPLSPHRTLLPPGAQPCTQPQPRLQRG